MIIYSFHSLIYDIDGEKKIQALDPPTNELSSIDNKYIDIYLYLYFDIRLEPRRTDVDKYPVFLIRICVKGNCTGMYDVREKRIILTPSCLSLSFFSFSLQRQMMIDVCYSFANVPVGPRKIVVCYFNDNTNKEKKKTAMCVHLSVCCGKKAPTSSIYMYVCYRA